MQWGTAACLCKARLRGLQLARGRGGTKKRVPRLPRPMQAREHVALAHFALRGAAALAELDRPANPAKSKGSPNRMKGANINLNLTILHNCLICDTLGMADIAP